MSSIFLADLVGEAWDTADELLRNGSSMMRKVGAEQEEIEQAEVGFISQSLGARQRQDMTPVNDERNEWEDLLRKQQDLWLRSRELQDLSSRDA